MRRYARITGTGSYLPPRRLTNHDLAAELAQRGIETSDEWIVERTGIHARHFAAPDVASSDLALEASKKALEAAGCQPQDIDLIIVATSTPDMVFPSTACILQNKLGANGCAAFDVQAVCSGFVYALTVADAMIQSGAASRALVVGSEVFSRILDFNDRTTCVLFGDGAGAVVLEASEQPGILASDLHADGKHVGILCVPGNVSGGQVLGDPLLKMDGQAVFKLAVGVLEKAARATLDKAGLTDADIDWLIPHQANIRIMQSTARKLKLSMDKVVVTVDQHGNTSAASIPLALDHGVRNGQVKPGQTVLLEGVGGGFTWGAVLLKM
ncbi:MULTISPECIES: beta-ketoacyl-ACP synthase III [Delftia]|jgi:3-oxoacyl-[acyl-carrier-protein] synthase-3|uniref:Beta-ketoacyl-[acyl-carrier-protein] synthase III n=5 Tax=cellular organisms TaxID=131567 RepID=FABH_DELAS|nr:MULTISPECIES: beta-ketoacyl-ACP synthase III [Delftia]A9BNK6.1 RecName: Full=Beta-ketoacyl-[acyl-carrier-protein] synthase III; Short=Beta-ketoacyl-ACP synthase III; Short=KAS III; AltName: Full=3-oxoacyl-[acyl-carrier-protein] synthase 3; AltName: Full=3-oxoacyl-[acyl-carrier-protein] synthase III [Delftia acidovorans SPH-1]MCP4017471.1 ketoacyl-ACP synthase III [Delftia sp.]OLE92720.1 MAG: 3-oxoacyl-ACP synthase [Delftia sp. 13_1_40CM_3_66_6]PIF36247.1 3-oxoacyl-[acyl-carrier-protein] synt